MWTVEAITSANRFHRTHAMRQKDLFIWFPNNGYIFIASSISFELAVQRMAPVYRGRRGRLAETHTTSARQFAVRNSG